VTETYGVVDNILTPGIVVDVDRDAAQGGDFGREFFEAGIVLSVLFATVSMNTPFFFFGKACWVEDGVQDGGEGGRVEGGGPFALVGVGHGEVRWGCAMGDFERGGELGLWKRRWRVWRVAALGEVG